MADSESRQYRKPVDKDQQKRLKYLDFVQIAAIYVIVCFTSLYDYAKDNSGPLKPGVEAIEETVKTVIGPFELLRFVDRKVDESITELERLVPSLVKTTSARAFGVASDVQRAGLVDTAKELFTRYEPVAEQYAVSAWTWLNRLPLFRQVAQIVLPTAAYWSDKYNEGVCYMADRGYTWSLYMPLIPIEKIVKVFEGADRGCRVASNGDAYIVEQ